jgi:hypothetical protein
MSTVISKTTQIDIQPRFGVALISIQYISEVKRLSIEIDGIGLGEAVNMLQNALDIITRNNNQTGMRSGPTEVHNG